MSYNLVLLSGNIPALRCQAGFYRQFSVIVGCPEHRVSEVPNMRKWVALRYPMYI